MKVKILETDDRLGVKKGEIYKAKRYEFDPQEKISLLSREPDGHDPRCNLYLHNAAYWMQGRWMVLDGTCYVPESA